MKKIIITVIALLMTFSSSISMFANEPEKQDNAVVTVETDVDVEDLNDSEELAEQEEKAQERVVLILIIIGMIIALGTLYTFKYIAYKKENN